MEEEGEEYEPLLAIAEGEMTFAEAGLGELSRQPSASTKPTSPPAEPARDCRGPTPTGRLTG